MSLFDNFLNIIISTIEGFGYFGVFLAVFLEYACLPLPSEILLPFIGLLASREAFSLPGIILVSVLAGLFGSTACYFLGYYGGAPIIDWLCSKSSGAKKSFKTLNVILTKYDKPAVFLSRLLPITRTYISLAVGAMKMNFTHFILYSLGGITIWNIILISLGYLLGENTDLIAKILKEYSIIAFVIIGIIAVIFGYKFFIRKNKTIENKQK